MVVLDFCSDFIYIADIALSFCFGYLSDFVVVRNRWKIAQRYLRSGERVSRIARQCRRWRGCASGQRS